MDKGTSSPLLSPSRSRVAEVLHVAAAKGRLENMRLLVEQGNVSVNALNREGRTALHYAAQAGHVEAVQYLLDKGADLQTQDEKSGSTALHLAAEAGHLNVVRCLIEKNIACASLQDKAEGFTALHLAAYKGHREVMCYLIEEGADPKLADQNGRTALHLAAYKGYLEVVEHLLAREVDPKLHDRKERTALHFAAYKGHIEVAELLLGKDSSLLDSSNYKSDLPIHIAVRYNQHTDFIQFLLRKDPMLLKKCNQDDNGVDNETLLHMAISNGHSDIVSFIVEKWLRNGLTVNVVNTRGETPLYYAVSYCNDLAIFQSLIEAGANLKLATQSGETPLHLAAYKGYSRIVSFLLGRGANPSQRNRHGEEPIHLAAEKCYARHEKHSKVAKIEAERDYAKTIEQLLLTTGKPNTPDNNGLTPLHLACHKGSKAIVALLLQRGANLYATDIAQHTALHFAVNQHHSEVVELLLAHEATCNKKNKSNKRALCEMTDKNGETVLHYLMKYQDKTAALLSHILEKGDNNREVAQELYDMREEQRRVQAQYRKNTEIHLKMVNTFLKQGIRWHHRNQDGKTILHLAIENIYSTHPEVQKARIALVKALLMYEMPLFSADKEGRYAIHLAVAMGDFESVSLLLKKDINQLYLTNKHDQTLLHLVSYNNSDSKLIHYLIKLYFQNNVGLNIADRRGFTPLHIAAYNHNLVAAKILVPAGANLYARDAEGNTVLHLLACSSDYTDNTRTAQYLVDQDMLLRQTPTEDEYKLQKLLKRYLSLKNQLVSDNRKTILTKILQEDLSSASDEMLDEKCSFLEKTLIQNGLLLNKQSGVSILQILKNLKGETAAHLAVHNGHLNLLQLLLNTGVDLHSTNEQQKTLLHIAAYHDYRLPMVDFLIRVGANLQARDDTGMSPFHIAIKHKCWRVARSLFMNGAPIDAMDYAGWTPLHYAVNNQDVEAVQFILNLCQPQLDIRGNDSKTVFYLAAENGSLEILRLLFDVEKIMPRSGKQYTFIPHNAPSMLTKLAPIHIALQNGHLDVVNYLMGKLSDSDLIDARGKTLLHYIAEYGQHNTGYIDIARRLMDQGLDKDVVDEDGCTPLHIAAKYNNLTLGEFLLVSGANVYINNKRGQNSCYVAVCYNHIEFVRLLIGRCAHTLNLSTYDSNGASLLHIAAWKNYIDLFQVLFEQGLSIIEKDKDGETVLHKSMGAHHVEMVKLILSLDASQKLLCTLNQDGDIPLHLAVRANLHDIVPLLLKHEPKQMELRDRNKKNALNIANELGYVRIYNTLLDAQRAASDASEILADVTPLHLQKGLGWLQWQYQDPFSQGDIIVIGHQSDSSVTSDDSREGSSLNSFQPR